jgi:hypothetical protein
MKKSSLVLVALLLTAPVFADEAVTVAEQQLTLASADTSASTNLKVVDADETAVRLEKEAKAASNSLSEKVEAELAETVAKAVAISVKF